MRIKSSTFHGCSYTEAHDALDPTGNITIKWDVISWTPDGYIVSDHNFLNVRKTLYCEF